MTPIHTIDQTPQNKDDAGNLENSYLKHNVNAIHSFILKEKQDYLTVISGWEGSGKSTLAAMMALWHDPEFDASTQVVYNIESFIEFLNLYEKTPGKVCWFDEACLAFLGEESNTKEAKYFKKVFITHRDLNHFYLMCAPSPWLLTPYIREWRVRDFILLYGDPFSANFDRYMAYYTKHEYAKFITNRKAKSQIILPREFVKIHKPAQIERFKLPDHEQFKELFDTVFGKKKEAQRQLRQDIHDYTSEGDTESQEVDDWLPQTAEKIIANIDKYKTEYRGQVSLNDALLNQDFGIGGRRISRLKHFVLPQLKQKQDAQP